MTREEAYTGGQKLQTYTKTRQIRPTMKYITSSHRGSLPSSKDNRESKKYVLVLTPPRQTTGGLLSSWLVDQQTTFDGHKWALRCPPRPRWWASHHATPPTVLGPGMDQDSSACRSVNTSCKKALPCREGEGRPSSTSCENEETNREGVCQTPCTIAPPSSLAQT